MFLQHVRQLDHLSVISVLYLSGDFSRMASIAIDLSSRIRDLRSQVEGV